MTDKRTIELNKKFDAPIVVLFNAIKDGQLLKSTGVKPDSFKHDFRVGGEFSLEWTSKTAGACTGRYLEIAPHEKVQFTWNSRGCDSAPENRRRGEDVRSQTNWSKHRPNYHAKNNT